MGNKTGATRLGFALLLKFFELEGRFPEDAGDVPTEVVEYVASQVRVEPSLLAKYEWAGRTNRYHRAQGDRQELGAWANVCARMTRWRWRQPGTVTPSPFLPGGAMPPPPPPQHFSRCALNTAAIHAVSAV